MESETSDVATDSALAEEPAASEADDSAAVAQAAIALFKQADKDGNGVLDLEEFLSLYRQQPQPKGVAGPASSSEANTMEDKARAVLEEWQRNEAEKKIRARSEDYFAEKAVVEEQPAEGEVFVAPVAQPKRRGSVIGQQVTRWQALSMGFGLASQMTAQAASSTADVAATLQQANERFLKTFHDHTVEALMVTQSEILAAKIPLGSYGLVKEALDRLKLELTVKAEEELTNEWDPTS